MSKVYKPRKMCKSILTIHKEIAKSNVNELFKMLKKRKVNERPEENKEVTEIDKTNMGKGSGPEAVSTDRERSSSSGKLHL